jgi:hypothetical protein
MKAAILCAVLLMAGCTHADVRNLGNGLHSLSAVSPSGGYSGSHEEAVEQANDFCAKFHQRAVIAGFEDKPDLGPLGEHTSDIMFTCAAPKQLHF